MAAQRSIVVAPSNEAQRAAWDGDEGAYWAAHPDHFDRSVGAYDRHLWAAAGIRPTDQVLDVGCGTGQTTRDAARLAIEGSALGIDLSSEMLDVARRRAADDGLRNASFVQGDAQVHPFEPAAVDVIISRTGAMFFGDLDEGFANLAAALVPGGRLALVVWQPLAANEWLREIITALAAGRDLPGPSPDGPGPFSLSDPRRAQELLGGAGFTDIAVQGHEEAMWFGTDADDGHRLLLGLNGWMLEGLDDAGRHQASAALHDTLAAHETPEGVLLGSAAWTISARRRG